MKLCQLQEAIPGRTISSTEPLTISFIDPEENWEEAEQVEIIAKKVGIRIGLKPIQIIAMVGDKVVGGVACYEHSNEEEGHTLNCDVVVDPQWQGYQRAGFQLIEAAISYARDLGAHTFEALVVNTRLARILVDKYGFDGELYDGRPSMLYKYL